MARYSRRRGPAVDFTIPGATTEIPGLRLTRHFDNGEILVLGKARIRNDDAVAQELFLSPLLDGTFIMNSTPTIALPAATRTTFFTFVFLPLTEGVHTVALGCNATNPNLGTVQANTAELTVIQLPLWDSDADIL